jgi:hypothetical protein
MVHFVEELVDFVDVWVYSGTCLIRHTKGQGKCVLQQLEYSCLI